MSKSSRSPELQKTSAVDDEREQLLARLSRLEAENAGLMQSIESLQKLTGHYETLLKASPDGFFRTDARGKLLEVNDAYCRMSGRTREELLHLYLSDLEVAETPPEILHRIARLKQSGFARFESRHKHTDGATFEVEVSASWRQEGSQILVFVRDISARKQAETRQAENQEHLTEISEALNTSLEELETTEEELRTSGEQLQQQNDELLVVQSELDSSRRHYEGLFQFAPYGYLVTDPEGTVRETNQAGLALLGVDEGALLGKTLVLFVAGQDREEYRSILERARAGEAAGSREREILMHRGGREAVFPAAVMVAPIREVDNSLSGLRWLLRDITEVKQAQAELEKYRLHLEEMVKDRTAQFEAANAKLQEEINERTRLEQAITESEEKYRNIVRLAPAAIFELDFPSRKMLSVNDTACQWTGYTREEMLGMDPYDLTDDSGRSIIQHRIERRQAGKTIEPTPEINIYTRDKRQLVWVLNAGTFTYQEGKPGSMLVVAHDITSRKRMEEEVRQTAEELRSANDELMRFNRAMVGRELRMIELKREINELCKLAGQPPRYPVEYDKSKR